MDKCDGCQNVAEKAAVCVAEYKYRKRRRKMNKKKVALANSQNKDRGSLVCGRVGPQNPRAHAHQSGRERNNFHGKREINPPLNPVKVHAIHRRWIVKTATGKQNKNAVEDYSQKELNNLHDHFSQKPNEPVVAWAVRLWEMRAHGVQMDAVDGTKFVQLSHEPVGKETFRTLIIQQPQEVCSMLDIVAMPLQHKYLSEVGWPRNEKVWFRLKA
ncbi:unnamed protein product [Ranitomeya imitator]|uniref:Uncharacterized protein n=1 Tax=Ranitomeya imitator TaxID=111125 RepID=A0ABN9LWS7_9NEOB|nr:unnamed protein product [Ranitomeya imitator]